MVALGGWLLFVLSLLLLVSVRRGGAWHWRLRSIAVVLAVLSAASGLALGSALYVDSHSSDGVIVAAEIDVASGPGPQYVTDVTLHSGAEVSLVEVRGNWARLALPGSELEGWIPISAVEPIDG
jgi:hypothetical protein